MKKSSLLVAAAVALFGAQLSAPGTACAQTLPVDPVVMEVNGQKIRQSEFMKEFMTSVGDKLAANPQTPQAEKRQALLEYVDLYANFKAKVIDAKAMGLDTAASLQQELAKYRSELAAPYLIDSTVLEGLLREAYERNHYSLGAAHILVRVAPDALPDDTLAAYKRISELRKRIADGEDFYAVAREEALRLDRNAEVRPNEGYLGYFSAFDMVYPFENAAYSLEVGQLSQPVRSRYGYHIIKLLDKVNLHGKLDLAHIWIGTRDSILGRAAIYSCYERLKGGESFATVANQSDDRSTRNDGGRMHNATLSNIPPEYLHVVEKLKPGEVSEPFHTQFGWHIVTLIRKDTLPAYEDMVPYYKQKMTRDQRGDASRRIFARNCRTKYGVVDLTKTPVEQPVAKKGAKKAKKNEPVKMQASLESIYRIVPSKVMMGRWDEYNDSLVKDIQPLVRVPGKEYTTLDLARYINTHREADRTSRVEYYVDQRYEEFIDSVAVAYADSQLEKEYPEFADIVDEYRRGLMIFSYNDKMIWSKAVQDTTGFAEFYDRCSKTKSLANREDSVYFWRHRARISMFDIADSSLLAPAKAQSIVAKAQKKSKGSLETKELLVKAVGKKTSDPSAVRVVVDLVEEGHTKYLAADQWKKGVYTTPNRKGYRVLEVEEVMPPMLKSRKEARGYYLNEYQNELEAKLIELLRKKYNVKINRDVVENINY